MKKRFYVFKAQYKQGDQGYANCLTLVATFEESAEADAFRFASAAVGGPFYIWTNGGENVEEGK